jgi:CBS domain-containing protein
MPWGVISDADLVAAAGPDCADRTARDSARTEVVTVTADDGIAHAARLMTEHGVTHLVVVQPATGKPVGAISTLDIAGALAWGEA